MSKDEKAPIYSQPTVAQIKQAIYRVHPEYALHPWDALIKKATKQERDEQKRLQRLDAI